jgi:hypothetical protein
MVYEGLRALRSPVGLIPRRVVELAGQVRFLFPACRQGQ